MLNLFDYIEEAAVKPIAARLSSSFDEFRLIFGEKATLTASPEAVVKYNLAKFGLEELTLNTQDPSSLGVFNALKEYAPEGKEVVAIVYLLDKEAKDKKPNYFANSRLEFKENEDITVAASSDSFALARILDDYKEENAKVYDFTLDALNIEKFFTNQEAHAIAAGKEPASVKDIYSRIPVTFYYTKRGSEDISYTRRLVDIDKFYFICKEVEAVVEEIETVEETVVLG
jgi:hypothetical protein